MASALLSTRMTHAPSRRRSNLLIEVSGLSIQFAACTQSALCAMDAAAEWRQLVAVYDGRGTQATAKAIDATPAAG